MSQVKKIDPAPHYECITDLPFVNDIGEAGRSFWDAKHTGRSEEDYAIGEMYARMAVQYMRQTGATYIVNWAIRDMPKKHTRLEVAFFNALAEYSIMRM